MKIGIITQPLHNNYGGLLQNFALQQVFRDAGYEPITFDWEIPKAPLWRKSASYIKRLIYKYLIKNHSLPKTEYILCNKEREIISQHTNKFIEKYISCTDKIYSSGDFLNLVKKMNIEVLVSGSDQVWRPKYSAGYIADMFLRFAENISVKRIAYAASFGTEKWEFTPKETICCSKLAKQFDLITIREESGIKLCKEYLGVKATHVLDPTMLMNKEVYEKIVTDNNTPISKGNLFHYILDPSKEKSAFVKSVSQNKGLVPFTIMPIYQAENRTKSNVKKEIDKCVFPGVEEWLRAFMDAEMVVCDSFHGCVFSIIFNKLFWVFDNTERGNTRFDSLLKTFKLEDRLITDPEKIDFYAPIDWREVNAIREKQRTFSKNLLLTTLK